jgi:5-methyltetrahydropteroyltriglutamate--homocysteine methyltransferase
MFATLVGPCPRLPAALDDDDAVRILLAEQAAAGLEPLVDGGMREAHRPSSLVAGLAGIEEVGGRFRATAEPTWREAVTVDGWRFAASSTERAVKQAIVGPYTLGRLVDPGGLGRERLTLALAEALREEILALAAAGCPFVQVDEDDATRIGDDPAERTLFREAQRRLTAGVGGVHLSLAVCGGNADGAGEATIFEAPYRSYLFDLIAGPDNWRLIARAPGDRGIVCGALDPARSASGALETLIWAARYAASTEGRGMSRVGLAPAGGLERVSPEQARSAMEMLGRAARLAEASRDELAKELDPRAFDAPWNRGRAGRDR